MYNEEFYNFLVSSKQRIFIDAGMEENIITEIINQVNLLID